LTAKFDNNNISLVSLKKSGFSNNYIRRKNKKNYSILRILCLSFFRDSLSLSISLSLPLSLSLSPSLSLLHLFLLSPILSLFLSFYLITNLSIVLLRQSYSKSFKFSASSYKFLFFWIKISLLSITLVD